MTYIKKRAKALALVIATLHLVACSKTAQWEEEVRLNTGHTIWLQREVVYSLQGGAGNPLDYKYRPTGDQRIAFAWNGRQYRYYGRGGFKVLAISPTGVPVLVKNADAGRWDASAKYACTIPFYVQFVPDQSGSVWTWPPKIEPWLYNLPTNLLLEIGEPTKMRNRYTHEEKLKQDFWTDPRQRFMQRIDPAYTGDLCKKGKK